ncbi:MAG: acyl-CoA thioesterase [Bacteroidales bacterium]|nr:acyl-CoA thioesterase [Bacteroidales bacterium]
MEGSIVSQCRVIFPGSLNSHETLFGGIAMQWMDEVAFITASRYARKKVVTTKVDHVKFYAPIKEGTIVELIGKVTKTSGVRIEVSVEMISEEILSGQKEKAIEAIFVLSPVNHLNKPIRI